MSTATRETTPRRSTHRRAAPTPAVTARGIVLQYPDGTRALDGVTLEVNRGEHVAILGSSGSGKSTLVACLSGRLEPTGGVVQCAGRTAVIHQDLRLVRQRSALQNTMHGALGRQRGFVRFPRDERSRAIELLQRVGLGGMIHQAVGRLSGGEQQRVAIARALMQRPSILLADEPIASLDETLARETMQLLGDLAKERELTMITVLHDCSLAERFADRIVGMEAGHVVYNARPRDAPTMEPIEHCRACQQINAARSTEAPPRIEGTRWRRATAWIVAALVLLAAYAGSIWSLDVGTEHLRGVGTGLARFLRDLVPSSWHQILGLPWGELLLSLLATLQMSLIGTTLGVLLSWPLAAMAAQNVGPRLLRRPVRFLLNMVRMVPSLIWALLFVAAVGFGELPGVMALAAYSVGYLTKFFYEAFEAVDPGPPDAVVEIGANGPQRFMHAVWPAARPAVLSSCLFMLEYNVRAASVLGIVGAGGIGYYIMLFVGDRNFPAVVACLALLLAVVLVLDAFSTRARAWLVKG